MAKVTPTILIAGGAGFVGSHLCDAYVATHQVICVDDLSTGRAVNIKHLLKNPNFTFIKTDVSKPLPKAITQQQYSVVANLASPASPPHYQRLALETLMTGAVGTWNLLELARQSNARFFHASTSEVYGDPEVHPQPESYRGSVNSYGPRSMYDEAKRFAEALIYSYRYKYELSTGIARFFNTYGPRMDPADGRVVSNFIVQAITGQPLTIYGDGKQTRSFCYISDLVDGIVKMIDSDVEGPINLGNPDEFTVKELGDLVLAKTGSASPFEYRAMAIDDPLQRQPVIDMAIEKLGWEPTTALIEGLEPTITYFKTEVANPVKASA